MYRMCSYVDIPGRAQGSTIFREVKLRHAHYSTWPCLMSHDPEKEKVLSTVGNSKRENKSQSFILSSHKVESSSRNLPPRPDPATELTKNATLHNIARHDPVSAMSRWHRRFTQENATALKRSQLFCRRITETSKDVSSCNVVLFSS